MPVLLDPANTLRKDRLAVFVVLLLAFSGVLVVVAAGAMPDGYSWRGHSISESAAQGQEHAWIARLAFLCFGTAVLALSLAARAHWPRVTYWMQLTFAGCMFGSAAFSHAPWMPGAPSDAFEDLVHSVCATGMGFAFCIGVLGRLAHRPESDRIGRVLDILALAAAVLLPLVLAFATTLGGVAQRVMFTIAYVWFGREAVRVLTHEDRSNRREG